MKKIKMLKKVKKINKMTRKFLLSLGAYPGGQSGTAEDGTSLRRKVRELRANAQYLEKEIYETGK